MSNNLIISYSNSGRTWLFNILGDCGLKFYKPLFASNSLHHIHHNTLLNEYNKFSKNKFEKYNTVFLHRNPIDVVVSNYYHTIYRTKNCNIGSISEFIRHPEYGIEKIIKYNLFWFNFFDKNKVLIVSYEQMITDVEMVVRSIINHFNEQVFENIVRESILKNSFEKMKLKENSTNIKSHKAREGKVNNYHNHLNYTDIQFCLDEIKKYKYGIHLNA